MDWSNPFTSLVNYFRGTPSNTVQQQQLKQAALQARQAQTAQLQQAVQATAGLAPFVQKAELPDPDEVTIKAYPTKNYLQPTKANDGTPWAAQNVPMGYIDGLAYAHAKAKSVGGLDEATLNQFLPLALRESRYHLGTAYGNNGVYVNYKTPPPKDLQGIIDQSNTIKKIEMKAWDDRNMDVYNDMKSKREALEAKLLADPRWKSRADSYHDVTNYVKRLGLEQTQRQEITRDEKTGMFTGKADVYMADNNAPYAVKALHVPLALYNKKYGEGRSGSGLDLTKTFVGGGKEADVRNKQEAEIGANVFTHIKNKPLLDYYNSRIEHHKRNIK